MRDFKAVVFDMDGVIFDSENAFIECWIELAGKYNIDGIVEVCHECLGVNYDTVCKIMIDHYGKDFPLEKTQKEVRELFNEKFSGGRLPIKPGAKALLKTLKEAGIKIGLASSTYKESVERQLSDAGLLEYFDVIVGGDMVTKSKPEPEIYIKACKLLDVKAEDAYAIEDSFNGIHSAYRAGLKTIMVPDIKQPDESLMNEIVTVQKSLNEVISYLFDK